MDSQDSHQDVIRCDCCETPVPPLHCVICRINLCKTCVGEHLLDESRDHKVVPFHRRRSIPICQYHKYVCELHCEQCHTPICAQCVSSTQHDLHRKRNNGRIKFKLLLTINLKDSGIKGLRSITCLNDGEFWTCGRDKIMKLFNIKGKTLKKTKALSVNNPSDITVTKRGLLVYTVHGDRSVNIFENEHMESVIVISFEGFRPRAICCTSSDDLLIFLISDDYKSTKVVRYNNGLKETQSIEGHGLYSPDPLKFICENRNLDICVTDTKARAIVGLKTDGSFRFRYNDPGSSAMKPFYLVGITTDSHGWILTSDCNNHCIHILHQDGHFLRFIDNQKILAPWGLSVDSSDNLFVVVYKHKVKKIQYHN